MKKKILTYALSALACLTSCSDWLDINHDPNTAEKVDPGYLFNYVAVNWAGTRTGGDFIFLYLLVRSVKLMVDLITVAGMNLYILFLLIVQGMSGNIIIL